MSFEDQVRERAYHLWLSGGMADGLEHEHWTIAEQAVKASEPVVILTKAKVAKAAAGKSAAAQSTAAKVKAAKPAKKVPAKTVNADKPAAKTAAKKVPKAESAAAC